MNYLLDTQIWIWAIISPDRIPIEAERILSDKGQSLFLSSMSIYETTIKQQLGKLELPLETYVETQILGIEILPFGAECARSVGDLPLFHRDPFDRAIVAQASYSDFTLITADRTLQSYSNFATILLVA